MNDATKTIDVEKIKKYLDTGEGLSKAEKLAETYDMPVESIIGNVAEQSKLINTIG
jgi:hypothetical protein